MTKVDIIHRMEIEALNLFMARKRRNAAAIAEAIGELESLAIKVTIMIQGAVRKSNVIALADYRRAS